MSKELIKLFLQLHLAKHDFAIINLKKRKDIKLFNICVFMNTLFGINTLFNGLQMDNEHQCVEDTFCFLFSWAGKH